MQQNKGMIHNKILFKLLFFIASSQQAIKSLTGQDKHQTLWSSSIQHSEHPCYKYAIAEITPFGLAEENLSLVVK